MKRFGEFVVSTLVGGLLVLAPLYLAVLLLIKAAQTLVGVVRPLAMLLPEWLPAEHVLSLALVLVICFLVGAAARTAGLRMLRDRIRRKVLDRIPGYELLRSLTQRLAGTGDEHTWEPALIDTDDGALVPAFIIEECDNGCVTVFVPSVPTPLAGAVYILSRDRVHPLDVPFAQAIKPISRWGSGCRELVAAMRRDDRARSARGHDRCA
jgi:uncharacterized membrane protein